MDEQLLETTLRVVLVSRPFLGKISEYRDVREMSRGGCSVDYYFSFPAWHWLYSAPVWLPLTGTYLKAILVRWILILN